MKHKNFTKLMIPVLLIVMASFSGCSKSNDQSNNTSDLYKTWILVKKEINMINTVLPEDDAYPITLTFLPDNKFHGRHDANTYEGTYIIQSDNISLSVTSITDVNDIEWYWDYINQLSNVRKFVLKDVDNLQLLNENNSNTFYFMSKNKFEEEYFELEE
ncbi:MAG: hypothetical protein FWD66_08895 [Paludibacter sp.]|nr:hypothetical protein [Paludibacter sp.]